MLLCNQVKGSEFPREKTNKTKGGQNNESITEKKIEKEVAEILARMGNNIRRI